MFRSVIDKYPETAHFVYELLQNADDANATAVDIVLKQDRLIFKHNGTKRFDVTPLNDDITGDINSITGIGNSSKDGMTIETQNKIGKFGVGFKSVFQYTDTPEIYDDTYCFKIENYIIPTLLNNDHPDRKQGETLFVFQFPSAKRQQAYDDIKSRLTNLQNPILFLRHLQKIVWRIDSADTKGQELKYEKKRIEERYYKGKDVRFERYILMEPKRTSSIFLFSREISITENDKKSIHPIYIGFFYDEEKKQLITSDCNRNIYCFFPTNETFDTCFISHAPFLLTDNRQNIKRDENLNKVLLNRLAELAATAIILLRDYGKLSQNLLINENLTCIIPDYASPYLNSNYGFYEDDDDDSSESFFHKPIISVFKELLTSEPLLLSHSGDYLLPDNSYTTHNGIYELLSRKQFQKLMERSGIDFIVWELAQNINKFSDDCLFFDDVRTFSIEDFGRSITAEFMANQPFEWVTKFYTFLREHASVHINISSQSKDLVFRSAPIIKTQKNEWVAPFINKTEPNVYLPLPGSVNKSSGYNFVNYQYLNDAIACKFFNQLELKTPDEYDYIRNIILEKYTTTNINLPKDTIVDDFFALLSYYQKIQHTEKEDEFINLAKKELLLMGTDETLHHPSDLYVETTEELKQYFGEDTKTAFFDLIYYVRNSHTFKTSFIKDFVLRLGGFTKPRLIYREKRYNWNIPPSVTKLFYRQDYYNDVIVKDKWLDGFEDAYNGNRITKDISIYLWNNVIGEILKQHVQANERCTICASTQRRSTWDYYYKELKLFQQLKQCKWIYDKEGKRHNVRDIHIEELAIEYNLGNGITEILEIPKAIVNLTEKYGVSEEVQNIYDFGAKAKAAGKGLTDEEKLAALEKAAREKEAENARERQQSNPQSLSDKPTISQTQPTDTPSSDESIEEKLNRRLEEKKNRHVGKPHSKAKDDGDTLIDNHTQENVSKGNNEPSFVKATIPNNQADSDEITKAEKNLKTKDTSAQTQAENTREQIQYFELLKQTQEYTFKWFKILMLLMHAGQDKGTKRQTQIDFFSNQFENGIIRLSDPTMPIPAWIGDAEKCAISAMIDNQSTKIDGLISRLDETSVDIVIRKEDHESAKEYLRKCMQVEMACKSANKFRIIAVDNTNIIDSLETRFLQLEKDDDFDMNANLPSNISFIYGPPGTGKTTALVQRVHDLLVNEPDAKILVLTPTNKAADVVAIKMSNDDVCEGGLARYGATESIYLSQNMECVTNRDNTDMDMYNIVVATAARYAYDFVQPNDTPICEYPWDYIFIDEASMIDILTITYILHKGAGAKQIIISGDPKQIQPVAQNNMPTYNIYSMVGLKGFADAIEKFERYEVMPLYVQHRSTKIIGDLVSDFAYDGLVDFDEKRAPQKPLDLDGIRIADVNFIEFEVADLDEIKGLNAIGDSAFNLYSVIFTYNMVEYTIKQIEKHYANKEYTIGIVCAYRAQADAIKNMLENRPLDTMYCKVTCGTVHSFQGDECDIMFIVLNPPANCTSGAHVNNENIINVAMSRARDYIFFVLPKGQQKGFYMKNVIGEKISFLNRTIHTCREIEKVMFYGNDNFIYENTHVTCHMPVNVYCENNAIYEVRMSDDAIDIKINNV